MLSRGAAFPGADPVTGARPLRDAWVWAVLPHSAASVRAAGGSLPATLAAAGLDVTGLDGPPADAVLLDASDGIPSGLWRRPDEFVAVALGGGADFVPERVARARRAASLALGAARSLPSALAGANAARAARRAGRGVTLMATSDRARPYLLGPGGPLRPRAGCIVAGYRGERPRTAVDDAVAAVRRAEPALRDPGTPSVVESGKLILRLTAENGDGGAVIRVAGGPARAMIDRAVRAAEVLGSDNAPEAVRELMPRSLAAGTAGVIGFAAERWVAGAHPRGVDARLWESCRAFLEALRTVPVAPARAGADVIAPDVAVIAPLVSEASRRRLERLSRWVGAELEGVTLGWAHGDFWPENLIVSGGDLDCVLDWDTSEEHELPVLDALDLLGLARPEDRLLTFGPRFRRVLLPLVRSGDKRLVDHCGSVGAPGDGRGLLALAWAWWARRTALTVRDYPDRYERPLWLAENLEQPLLGDCPV